MKRHFLLVALFSLCSAGTAHAQQKPTLDLTDILPKKDH